MYHYVKDKEFLKRAYSESSDLVNQLVQKLRKNGVHARMNVVGSMKRNMVLQNENEPIDFDFNVLIENPEAFRSEGDLKETVRKAFNEVLSSKGWKDCDDSTSVLSTKQKAYQQGNKTPFSIDVCIVKQDRHGFHRLIHKKTGNMARDQWYWNLIPDTQGLHEKEKALKPDYWLMVRETYLNKKNMYLSRSDEDHPSFKCYIEAINEVYEKVKRDVK